MKTYRGSPTAARTYVEAGRARVDDYYLAEGTGFAELRAASPGAGVRRLTPLTGDAYEAWVAGLDPATQTPKGRLRNDEAAVRFVEVVVNGPKTWSLAAELHSDISAAYDAAQDRAADQILAWLAQHATVRVGPRGNQIQVPVHEIEAVTVRHYTSRAGDPHRHLHLQINARVQAEGAWRGLHTVGVRDSLDAINGIGHAAVLTHPQFRAALAGHGFTVDPDTGEVEQLAGFASPFSARAAQIVGHRDRYETEWRTTHPRAEPGPGLRRAWDARAWAEDRPDKISPRAGADLTERWVGELHALGYRDTRPFALPMVLDATPIGALDRDAAGGEVLTRLAARRSAWNGADIRGEVEQLIARKGIVTDPAVRMELADDLTARAVAQCVRLLDREGVPEHIRALTSRHVLQVEADLTSRLAARADTSVPIAVALVRPGSPAAAHADLDHTQSAVVEVLTSRRGLVVVEGAAGAGKTTLLAAARGDLEAQGRRLVVVTPTLKAATVAARETGATAGSAAWLVYQHGWRWTSDGAWTRLSPGDLDPVTGAAYPGPTGDACLRRADLLLVDEAGMLGQDTARALLTLADESGARVALVGDRHQLPAVGRGGVLDLATRWASADACLTLDTVHRFTRKATGSDGAALSVRDEEYAALSLAIRAGSDPAAVFDTLTEREQIRVHASDQERTRALAAAAVDALQSGTLAVVVADTREQVAALNAAIRDRLILAGRVDDQQVIVTDAGQRVGAGDRVATRRNDATLEVANRDTWAVIRVGGDGAVTVTGEHGQRVLPPDYVREHVELAYASTAHGAQGETVSVAHAAVSDHTTAAVAYVAMTRGREGNVAHLVADTVEEARQQWVAVFGRDRADLGPAHAAQLAAQEAARYAKPRPLRLVLAELHQAWTVEADCVQRLADATERRDLLADVVDLSRDRDVTVPPLEREYQDARRHAEQIAARAAQAEAAVTARTEQLSAALTTAWEEQRPAARAAAHVVHRGPGRFGQRHVAVNAATEELARWSAAWQPYLPAMPTRTADVARFADWADDTPRIHHAFHTYARGVAEHANPEYTAARAAGEAAGRHRDQTWRGYQHAASNYSEALSHYGRLGFLDDLATALTDLEHTITADTSHLAAARASITALLADPALRVLPADRVAAEYDHWTFTHEADTWRRHAAPRTDPRPGAVEARRSQDHEWHPAQPAADRSPGISR